MLLDYEKEIDGVKQDISDLQKDVTEIKTIQPFLQNMLERNTESNEKLVETLHEVEKSMVSITNKLDIQSQDISSIKAEMGEQIITFKNKISQVESKINSVDEEGKFNIRLFFRQYFPWIVVFIGIGASLIEKFVKF